MTPSLELLCRGAAEILPREEFFHRLGTGRPLRVKAGFDPTAPDIHLGHTVVLTKLRQFQDQGHQILFLVGDFTARIGDPTGKNVTRPPLSAAEIQVNAQTYCDQAFKILNPALTEVVFNGSWMNQMPAAELVRVASRYTVARMLERDDFKRRYANEQAIAIHEFLYPLVQGYDSVHLKADLEIGGTDQKFNLLVGRHLQEAYGQRPQVIMTMPLLEGRDGLQKMSKSLDNYIGISDSPDAMFGKIMSISDELMWRYFDLLSLRSREDLTDLRTREEAGRNPRDTKFELAHELVGRFHGVAAAAQAQQDFISRFTSREVPTQAEELLLWCDTDAQTVSLTLKALGFAASTSDARRLMVQGAVRINSARIADPLAAIPSPGRYLVEVGKRKVAWLTLARG
ncbi:MAG: tyrosine--tRNA ligase [Gammaproteobacteria bacterium]|nr:tyrosine--tRNA ligase [Gammaproteobacteria bacterium]